MVWSEFITTVIIYQVFSLRAIGPISVTEHTPAKAGTPGDIAQFSKLGKILKG